MTTIVLGDVNLYTFRQIRFVLLTITKSGMGVGNSFEHGNFRSLDMVPSRRIFVVGYTLIMVQFVMEMLWP
ncbi:hypothetical protein M501DRAFT_995477 [Patellaria atrata CBS 101060]|uniref:Uncharacterized protein n=1 Tax=Patellaria atrata CBS 101060 TaxID=1346257 RepID=A0A9P4S7H3_9PEZI|nr:hypothetical protein M501DRAFT_995477 [Patellaria atrata CBS 101060]